MGPTARLPGLGADEWTAEVRDLLGATLGPVARLEGGDEGSGRTEATGDARPLSILTVLAHQPRLLGPFLGWASALALEGALERREHELLALRTAANCRSDFEWGHHADYARAAGMNDEEIARIAEGPDAGWRDADAALLRAADELFRDASIGDSTWEALAANHAAASLVEIPLVVGQYVMLSMVANATGVALEPGHDPLPDPTASSS
jgi:4-carboxymuconolactone decarboxylase